PCNGLDDEHRVEQLRPLSPVLDRQVDAGQADLGERLHRAERVAVAGELLGQRRRDARRELDERLLLLGQPEIHRAIRTSFAGLSRTGNAAARYTARAPGARAHAESRETSTGTGDAATASSSRSAIAVAAG